MVKHRAGDHKRKVACDHGDKRLGWQSWAEGERRGDERDETFCWFAHYSLLDAFDFGKGIAPDFCLQNLFDLFR